MNNRAPGDLRARTAALLLSGLLLAIAGCDSGSGETTTSSDPAPASTGTPPPDANTAQQPPGTDPGQPSATPTETPASTAQEWADSIAGKHIHVFVDATAGSTGGGGDVFVSGGERYDIYLCTDRTYTGSYEDTTCVSASVPGMDQSTCDGSSTVEQYSGTWDVVIEQSIPYLALQLSQVGETAHFSLGSDGTTFFVDQVPATLAANPYCQ